MDHGFELSNRLNGIEEYYFSRKLAEIAALNASGKQIINLGIGSPDLAPHPSVIEALCQKAHESSSHGYQSYLGTNGLRQSISQFYKTFYDVDLDYKSEILPLIGSKEGIMHICMTFLNSGNKVLIPNPGYPTYSSAVKLSGAIPVYYNLTFENDWEPNFEEIEATDLHDVKMMWVNYPHMPTGKKGNKSLFEKIIQFGLKHSILICHDNPYSFILNDNPLSILSVAGSKDIAIELNSLSKSHNMPGWRVGMLLGASHFIKSVLCFKSNMDSGMFLGIQTAAEKALNLEKNWFKELNAIYKQRRTHAAAILEAIGCTIENKDQVGLFLWGKIPDSCKDSYSLSDTILYEHDVFITPGGIFGSNGERYVRISLCASESVLLNALLKINHGKNK
ncbi:MAG: aminotransferase class I/II-fold pyridoxal phosphate-dependent enzyme [Alphaproteobacteria bacterium]|nr:aminotransferase class I/II-fold pyridoxal phosphate-dependent enzyme [Alphaproteobacteria bacterium]